MVLLEARPVMFQDFEEVRFPTDAGGHESIVVAPGKQVLVILPGNPSTGYSWSITTQKDVQGTYGGGLSFEGDGYIADSVSKKVVGAGGTFQFRFKAPEKQGTYSVSFKYSRAFDDETPANSATVNVSVVSSDLSQL